MLLIFHPLNKIFTKLLEKSLSEFKKSAAANPDYLL